MEQEREKVRRPVKRHHAQVTKQRQWKSGRRASMDISLVAFLFVGRRTTTPATFCGGHGKRQPELTWQIFFNPQRHPEPSFLTASLEQGGCFWFTTHAGQNVSLPYGLTVFTSHSFMPRFWITARTLLRDSPHELIINVPGSESGWAFISITQAEWWIELCSGCILCFSISLILLLAF